jgi:hypothetical protein
MFSVPLISLYLFTGLETKEELIALLGVNPDGAWTRNEDCEYWTTDDGNDMVFLDGPNSTGAVFHSPHNNDPTAQYDDRLEALLDRISPIAEALTKLRENHTHPFGNMETVLRVHGEIAPNSSTGFAMDPDNIDRIVALGADIFFDFAVSPFDARDGRRFRLRHIPNEDETSS